MRGQCIDSDECRGKTLGISEWEEANSQAFPPALISSVRLTPWTEPLQLCFVKMRWSPSCRLDGFNHSGIATLFSGSERVHTRSLSSPRSEEHTSELQS